MDRCFNIPSRHPLSSVSFIPSSLVPLSQASLFFVCPSSSLTVGLLFCYSVPFPGSESLCYLCLFCSYLGNSVKKSPEQNVVIYFGNGLIDMFGADVMGSLEACHINLLDADVEKVFSLDSEK